MLDFDTAKMHIQNTMDKAFSKKVGTKKQRIAMANKCCSMVPTAHDVNVSLKIWATEYAANWS